MSGHKTKVILKAFRFVKIYFNAYFPLKKNEIVRKNSRLTKQENC